MKSRFFLISCALILGPIQSRATRPDVPPTDVRAQACAATLGLAPREARSVAVYAPARHLGRPDEVDLILTDEVIDHRRIVRTVQLRFSRLRSDSPSVRSSLEDDEIVTRTFTLPEFTMFIGSREKIGTVDLRIATSTESPTRYTGDQALRVGDIVSSGGKYLLILNAQATRRYDADDGYVSGTTYGALKFSEAPKAGLEIGRKKMTELTIEEYSYSGSGELPTLVGHAKFDGRVSNVGGLKYGVRLKSFKARKPEATELVRVWISNYQGSYQKRRPPAL